ncbi:MAG TPA: crosslink repair DNA glycosylase YcaQ family protein [Terriglobales bacterium]|jgi:23S rRNA pseudouridine2605 synthase|nr:crosslink repair DNA glycosylase YcaQ family protein [Terriglobales bacterium]
MTDAELLQTRSQKWRLDGQSVRTLDDARTFLESVGFCLMYPTRPAVLLPTFVGAWVGADDKLPTRQHAFSDPRAKEATELMVRMLRDQAAYEAPLSDEDNPFLVSASVFPYFYSLVGERNPKQPPVLGPRSPYSPLACDAFELIRRRGPISKSKLGEMLGGSVSNAGLDRALGELWAKLRITRVDYTVEAGSVWDELSRWAPEVVREGVGISVPEALSALVSKYLDCAVAVDEGDVEKFLSSFVPRTRVKEAIHALLSARELSFVHVGSKSLLQVTPPKQAYVPKPRPVRVS